MNWRTAKRARILDFDIEARPLSWIAADYVSKEVTAIAWKWVGERGPVECVLLGELDLRAVLLAFVEQYDQATMVTGHYIRGYDLPTLNGAMLEVGLPPLANKLASDTKLDLKKKSGLGGSQRDLAAMLGVGAGKYEMNQSMWRAANRLTPEGLAETRKRCVGDVKQHIELRARLLDAGFLEPPKVWRNG